MSEDICDGVKILVERMKTNPEEFADDHGKWGGLIKNAWYEDVTDWAAALNPTEIEMLKEARRKVYREKFTAHVVSTLLKTEDAPTLTATSTIAPNPYLTQNLVKYDHTVYGGTIAVGGTGGGGLSGIGNGTNTVITDSMMERFEKAYKEYKKKGGK